MRSFNALIVLAAAAGLVAACSTADGGLEDASDVSFASFNLEAEDGGFDPAASTIEAFEEDDPEAFEEEAPGMDEPLVDAEVADLGDATMLESYEIRIMWGQRHLNPGTPVTDWSGAVSTNVGALRVIRAIRFEQNDSVLPRTSPQSVEFNSHTTVHNDGLRLRLIRRTTPLTDAAPALNIMMGDNIDISIPHARLRHLIRAKKVDDLGNGLAIVAYKRTACPKGLLAGSWRKINKKGGVFGGKVVNSNGEKIGRLAGIWGTRANGKRRFFGLYVQDGKPAGLVRGTWKSLPNKAGGMFRGHFVSKDKEHTGVLRGFYKHADDVPGGRFVGMWAEKGCNADDEPTTATPSEIAPTDADLCSADGVCVAEPQATCTGDECDDTTDE